ncbi:MAG TPA: thioesterase family protein [Gemmatimonadales bacterium]
MIPHRIEIQVRFADTDALGHINNASYATWSELARLRFLGESDHAPVTFILAHLAIDFRRQVDYTDTVHVESRISAIGNTSFTMAQVVYANGAVAAEVKSVIVSFDYRGQRSIPIPASFRTWLDSRA